MHLRGRNRWKWLGILGLLAILWIARGAVFRSLITYRVVKERSIVLIIPARISEIPFNSGAGMSAEELLLSAQMLTAERLQFSREAMTIYPNEMEPGCKTHCVGYAAWCAAMTQYQLTISASSEMQVHHVVCKLSFLGADLHSLFSDPFFIDHDAVLLTDASGKPVVLVDPVLYDYTGIQWVREDQD